MFIKVLTSLGGRGVEPQLLSLGVHHLDLERILTRPH